MNTATKPRSHKGITRTNIGASKSVCALMVQLTWTGAPTVTITARKDFELETLTVDTRTGVIVAVTLVSIPVGAVRYFSKSSFSSLYYIGCVNASGIATCTCPHYQNLHECKHQPLMEEVYQAKVQRVEKQFAAIGAIVEQEELSPAEKLATATPEERSNIWKGIAMREKRLKKERIDSYWHSVRELQDAQKMPTECQEDAYLPAAGDRVIVPASGEYAGTHGIVHSVYGSSYTKTDVALVVVESKGFVFSFSELVLEIDALLDEEARYSQWTSQELAVGA